MEVAIGSEHEPLLELAILPVPVLMVTSASVLCRLTSPG